MDSCILCKSSKKDDVQYGEFLKKKYIGVHTFCLYLSSNLPQNGRDDEGFLGFLEEDIKEEVKRISFLRCCYCRKKYPNIGCCKRKCRRSFHFICGLIHDAENQFCRDFRSFCHAHVTKVRQRPQTNETCLICYESIRAAGKSFKSVHMILTPCCRNGWFHKLCLQKFAKTAGYFFKCPLCNDVNTFREKLPARGIFIPNRDAAWELEPNAFAELLERPSECTAQQCQNKRGRKVRSDSNPFVMCSTCGSAAMHRKCIPKDDTQFHCLDCTRALEEGDSGRESLNLYGNYDNEDECIDVCHASDKEDLDIVCELVGMNSQMGENQRDSGTHHDIDISDEEISLKSRNCNNNETISNADTEEDVIKPNAGMRKMRLRIDSESSDLSHTSNTRVRSDGSLENEEITHGRNINTKRLVSKSESGATNEHKITKSGTGTSLNIFNNSDSEEQEDRNIKAAQLVINSHKSKMPDSESIKTEINLPSTEEKFVKSARKRKFLNVTDSEGKKRTFLKQKSLDSNIFEIESDEEDDDDPLENFPKFLERKNKLKCLTEYQDATEKENKKVEARFERTQSKYANLKSVENCSENKRNFDISCVVRTRYKSTCSSDKNKVEQEEDSLNNSYLAVRTRRKTICAQTDYSKQLAHEMSQIYEKLHKSNEIIEISDDDSEFKYKSKEAAIDDIYEKRDSRFDTSCIANRTRRRKSLKSKSNRLPTIHDDPDSSLDTSDVHINFSRRRTRRITSSSSNEFETATILPKKRTISYE